jgi:hypothetical protein
MSIFTVRTSASDVEAVMGAVGDALREWEGGDALPLDLSLVQSQNEQLTDQAHQLRLQWNVDGSAIIHSTRPRIGPWIIRFQLVVRRLTWWFLEPILLQIRMFQMNTAQVVDGLAQNQEAMLARTLELQDLSQRVEALERKLSEPGERRDAA